MRKILAVALALLMIVSIVPMTIFSANAAEVASLSFSTAGVEIIENDESTLAPGVTLNKLIAYDKNRQRVEMYVTRADTTVETVKVYANYINNQNAVLGMQTLTEQVAAMEANYPEPFRVVAGINASYYNISNGKPTGAFVMEGSDITNEAEGNNYPFFAVLKDGTYMIGAKGEYSSYKGQIKEAVGGYIHIVKNGAVVAGLEKAKYPRQTLGLTADGQLILMTADGSRTPATIGLTVEEQAQVMLDMGCVEAIHLDGGNSAMLGTIPEGSDEFVLTNFPPSGAERAVSNTLVIVSTAISDGTFDHSVITGEYDYFLPNSTYEFSATGVDAAGGPADIPESVTWGLSDSSFGAVEDGVFTSNGTLGEVDIQMLNEGKVVGTKTIYVVNPDEITFGATEKTVPYTKSAPLVVSALYGEYDVYATADAFDFTLSNAAAGSFSGFNFTATDNETITQTTVTATYKYDAELAAATVIVKFGKGSEILFDFEDGDVSDWQGLDTISEWIDEENAKVPGDAIHKINTLKQYNNDTQILGGETFLSSKENGTPVKNGENSLGLTFKKVYNEDVGGWNYNYLYYTGDPIVFRDLANGKTATKIGMWMYFPPEAYGLYARICHTYGNGAPSSTGYAYYQSDYGAISNFKNMPEDGWVYITHNLTSYSYDSSTRFDPYKLYHSNPINDYFPAFLQFFANTDDMEAELLTIYIDDITLDYSDVVEDRNPPVISAPQVAVGANDFTALNGQTVTNNNVGFAATIAENTTKTNFTGLDYTTAKIYIDGADVSGKTGFSAAGSTISLGNLYLSNGEHRVTFEIADKQGNNTRLTKTITVDGDADNYPVWLDGYNNSGELAENGSIYYLDIGADYISQIDTVTAKLKLNTAHTFEFDHIWADDGVTFTYDYDQLTNTITLNITNVDSSKRDGTLVSVPVRIWEWNEEITGTSKAAQFATNNNPIVRIQAEIVEGNVTFKEGVLSNDYLTGFYSKVDVATKINDIVNPWHTHAPYAVPDVAPNCTESGYTGRTYCDGCESIMDWGTTVPAKGHTYDFDEDGDLRCVDCGDWFSGIYDGDGLLYVDGVVADGWSGNYCYSNGATLVGIQKVEAPDGSGEFYYNFGDNGECEGQAKYTGLIYIKSGDTYQYALAGTLTNGWVMIGEDWYYFDTTTNNAASGTVNVGGIDFEFETNGKLTQGVWLHTLFGERYYYGPDYYKKNWQTIDGKDYYFENEVCLAGGYQQIRSWDNQCVWYYFNEDGSCDRTAEIPDGFYTDRNGLGYSKDGIGYTGLQEIDGDWYYFDHRGYALIGTFAGRLFGEDYKGYTGLLDKAGVLYYYEDGVAGPYGLLELDDDYYFVNWGGVIATNGSYYASATNCDLPIGTYTFDEDGKALNGVYDGILYINGDTAGKGLYKVGDDYYLSNWGGVLETDGRYHVATTYCDISAGRSYYFGADGKMLNGVVETDGKLYLYINGDTTRNGLYKVGDDYYLSDWGGLLKTDGRYHVATTNCDIPAGRSYYFGADGKMLNGIYDGILYINGDTTSKGLFKIGDDYYLSYWGGVIFTDGRYHVDTTYCDIPAGRSYYFGADGKMLNGVVETDGTLYLYINGDTTRSGLYKVGDDYYLSNWGGVLKTDGTYYASATYCDLPIGNYIIGADGKMLNGIYDGILYINGDTTRSGLYKVGDDYYLSDWGGVLKTDGTYYASATYCDLPIGNYTVGADGKVLDGFVTKTDGIYLYQNGATAPIGLIEIDGSYYYVYWGGKLITSQTFHATVTNGLSIPKSYKFDATGKIIG